MSEPVMRLWGEDDRPEGWSQEDFAALCELACIKHLVRMCVDEVKSYPPDLRRAAYECARSIFREYWGLALCEDNRMDDPAKWKQPFRQMVITCAREIEHNTKEF